jgi:4'-phosphopantetheinyl transferase
VPSKTAWPRLVATSDDAWLWLLDLDEAPLDGAAARTLLADDENARAARFVFDVHRSRFVVCRAALRTLLADRLGCAPGEVRFEYGPAGKPSLAGGGDLRFNVSHSDRYALLGLAHGVELGVDIEHMRPLRDMDLVAARVFSPAERETLARVGPDRKVETFFAGWTRKEAYIKARGEGIELLGAIEVALAPGDTPRLIRVDGQPAELDRWSIDAFTPVPGFAAAVCLEGRNRRWNSL